MFYKPSLNVMFVQFADYTSISGLCNGTKVWVLVSFIEVRLAGGRQRKVAEIVMKGDESEKC